jgi:hypothetical protein
LYLFAMKASIVSLNCWEMVKRVFLLIVQNTKCPVVKNKLF